MAGQVITGTRGAYQQPSRWGRNESGNWEIYVFHGTKAEMAALARSYSTQLGLSYEVTESYGTWHLEVRFPWNADGLVNPNTDFVETWEFFAEHAEKDILESVIFEVSILIPEQVAYIRNLIQNPPNVLENPTSAPEEEDFLLDNFAGTTLENAFAAFELYKLMQRGVRSVLVQVPKLRHTIITSNQYTASHSNVNAGKIFTTPTLIATERIPGTLLFDLPFDVDNPSETELKYGWFKNFPTISQVALLKWQIVTEWGYGWWSQFLYGDPL